MISIFACTLFWGVLLLQIVTSSTAAIAAADQCIDYGYNPDKLSCTTCKQAIAKIFTEQHVIFEKCMSCCQNDEVRSGLDESYAKAVLMVDKTALKFLPDIEYMVKNKKKYNLNVKYRYGPPQLALYKQKDDDDPSDSISIHNWTKDTIIEYLTSHLDGVENNTKKKEKSKK